MNIPYGPILVVEDVPNILDLLAVTLRFKGYPVITAPNGQEALERIAEQRPALVITDILMPKMDGFALMHKLRTDPKTNQIPVVFLSATYVTPEDKAFALSLGAARFLEKPVDTEEFLLTVAEILTQGPPTVPAPMAQDKFYQGYRERLEPVVGWSDFPFQALGDGRTALRILRLDRHRQLLYRQRRRADSDIHCRLTPRPHKGRSVRRQRVRRCSIADRVYRGGR